MDEDTSVEQIKTISKSCQLNFHESCVTENCQCTKHWCPHVDEKETNMQNSATVGGEIKLREDAISKSQLKRYEHTINSSLENEGITHSFPYSDDDGIQHLWCREGHKWTRPSQRGRPPHYCEEHKE